MAFEPVEKIREAEAEAQRIRRDAADTAKKISEEAEAQIRSELAALDASVSERVAESRVSGQKEADNVYNKGCEDADREARELVQKASADVKTVADSCVERILAEWLS